MEEHRRGPGRPKGRLNTKTRVLALAVAEQGVTPAEVMFDNMRFWFEGAQNTTVRLQELANSISGKELVRGSARVKELFRLLEAISNFREYAQKCAVDLAPYVHSRLASITIDAPKEYPFQKVIEAGMTAREAAQTYAGTINSSEGELAS